MKKLKNWIFLYLRVQEIEAIAQNVTWANLKEFGLGENQIGILDVKFIESNPSWKNLKKLNLNWNWIREEGAEVIGRNLTLVNLKELYFCNPIGYKDVVMLCNNSNWKKLALLYFDASQLRNEQIHAVKSHCQHKKIETV